MNKFILTYIILFLASLTIGAQSPLDGLKKVQDAAGKATKTVQDATKGAQDAMKGAQDAAKGAQDAVKGAQDAAKGAQDAAKKSKEAIGQALQNYARMNNAIQGAPQVKVFTLLPGEPHTDSLSLATSDGSSDVTITFTYDQAESALKVVMESDKILHVFRRDAVYKDIIREWLLFKHRRLNVFKLPYEVESPADADYKISKAMKRSFGSRKARRDYMFHQWDDVTPFKQINTGKFSMLNDRIEQTYKVEEGVDNFSFTLRDVMVLTHNPKKPKKYNNYLIENLKDFNIHYMVVLMKDPCYGMENEIEEGNKACEELKTELEKLNTSFPDGVAQSVDQLKNFQTMRNTLLKKYSRKDMESPCENLQKSWNEYNALVDSLTSMTCNLSSELAERAANSEMVLGLDGRTAGIDALGLLFKARQIDELVNAWKVTRNRKDRGAYKQQCEKIISDAEKQVVGKYAVTKEQKDAVNTITKAIEYFNNTCK